MVNEQSGILKPTINDIPKRQITPRVYWEIVWFISTFIFVVIQLSLGTDVTIVTLAFLSLVICVIPLLLYGIYDIGTLFIFALLSKYSLFPFWIKTLIGERIDIGLTSPILTFEVTLVGSLICCIALLLVKKIPLRIKPVNFNLNNQQVLAAGYLSILFGLLFLILHIIFTPVILPNGEQTSGFGGFGSLVGPLYFGICCITVVSLKANTNPIHKFSLFLLLIIIGLLSLQTNAKVEITLGVFTVGLTVFYFRIKIKLLYVFLTCSFVVFYIFIFAPIIHLTRTNNFKTANFFGKISIIENMIGLYSLQDLDNQSNELFNYKYYPSIHSFFIDRVEMTQDMDIAVGGITSLNTIHWIPVQWAFYSILPSFIVHNKPTISDIDLIAYNAGYYPKLVTLNHTIGVFGSAYAMFLWPGLIFISSGIMILYLLLLKFNCSIKSDT